MNSQPPATPALPPPTTQDDRVLALDEHLSTLRVWFAEQVDSVRVIAIQSPT